MDACYNMYVRFDNMQMQSLPSQIGFAKIAWSLNVKRVILQSNAL